MVLWRQIPYLAPPIPLDVSWNLLRRFHYSLGRSKKISVPSTSTWDTRRPYWLPLSVITFLPLLSTSVVSRSRRMINHSLADTCICVVLRCGPFTTRYRRRVFVIDHQSSSFQSSFKLWLWQYWRRVRLALLPRSDVWTLGGSRQSPTVDDS
ncbi:hypothetical protein EV401DRAFT_4493 [Pisolithus croceorrhizus]|nr:hypothetical protein EV401DRAFT_4493 [Pisolithus croceorrhizus]